VNPSQDKVSYLTHLSLSSKIFFVRRESPLQCSLAHVKKIVSIKISREVQHR
jgi:hypothetical protein